MINTIKKILPFNYFLLINCSVLVGQTKENPSCIPADSAVVSSGMTGKAIKPNEYVLLRQNSKTIGANEKKKLLYADDFSMNKGDWIAEFEKPSSSSLSWKSSALDISASAGATVWYKKKLSGDIMITYEITVIDSGGKTDRVSDLNLFWMATDSLRENVFGRNGKFPSYDNLSLYYAGIGGNENSTTRFRKYHPNGEKPVLCEFTDRKHLLEGNTKYSIKVIVNRGRTLVYRNDELYFDFTDNKPLTQGYFGFRTTRSHQRIKNFRVFRLITE